MLIEMKKEDTAMISHTQGETEDIQNCDASEDMVDKNLDNPKMTKRKCWLISQT